jgi:hypothetical protein
MQRNEVWGGYQNNMENTGGTTTSKEGTRWREGEQEVERIYCERLERYIGHDEFLGHRSGKGERSSRKEIKMRNLSNGVESPGIQREKILQSSIADISKTLKWDRSLENSDHPVTSRQLY